MNDKPVAFFALQGMIGFKFSSGNNGKEQPFSNIYYNQILQKH
jgi:hypothetical protein